MKRVIMLFLFTATALISFAQRQTNGESKIWIRIHKTAFSITNDFITDSGRRVSPEFIDYPFKEEVFFITGPLVRLSAINVDSEEQIRGSYSSELQDTAAQDKDLFPLQNLQINISRNKQASDTWKDLSAMPVSFINDTVQLNDTLVVAIRNKQKPGVVLRMRFVRSERPVMPFLAMMMQDSSTALSETEFIKNAVETGNEEFKIINQFYKNWPPKYGLGTNNQPYFPSSKIAFYFRKYNDTYADSSLEYTLLTDGNKDTSWHSSGHLILITKLESNHHYTLLVRYKKAPENIWQNHFYVAPLWYQTSVFLTTTGLFTGLVGTFIIFFIVNRRRLKREKRKWETLQLEQKAVRAQLNPHFTFNAMSSIQSLMNQGKIDEANYYLTEFSTLLRESLQHNEKEMLPLTLELQILDRYSKLEQLRFHFHYNITVTPTININTTEIPSLLLQPLVENAIKHGISKLYERGIMSITVDLKNNDIVVTISDNGTGFTVDEQKKGYGLRLTEERIRLLNESLKQTVLMNINSKPTGTDIYITFKNWLA